MSGPPPTPTAILEARGSWRAKTRANEPKPQSGKPTCPSWLDDAAKAEWRRVTTTLDAMGVLTKADGNAVARYCVLVVAFHSCDLDTQLKIADRLLKLEQQFGLTPSARAGLATRKESEPTENRGKSRFFPSASA